MILSKYTYSYVNIMFGYFLTVVHKYCDIDLYVLWVHNLITDLTSKTRKQIQFS